MVRSPHSAVGRQPIGPWENRPFKSVMFNTFKPRQNGRHFADDTFKPIFLNENIRILFKISMKFFLKVPINNIPALVQIMAWCRPGDKPLSEPMMVCLLTHMCVTRPRWVKLILTLKRLGHFFQYVILFRNVVQLKCNVFIWNWSNKLNV